MENICLFAIPKQPHRTKYELKTHTRIRFDIKKKVTLIWIESHKKKAANEILASIRVKKTCTIPSSAIFVRQNFDNRRNSIETSCFQQNTENTRKSLEHNKKILFRFSTMLLLLFNIRKSDEEWNQTKRKQKLVVKVQVQSTRRKNNK